MKNIKRIIALLMVVFLVAGLTACHKKGETAVKVKYSVNGEEKEMLFSSGYYACVLYFTDNSARSKVQNEVSEEGGDTSNIDYYSRQVEGKSYVDYVKEETLKYIKKIAACKAYCEAQGITLSDDEAASVKSDAESYWDYQIDSKTAYSDIFTKNGFSKETLIAYMTDASYEELWFDHLYAAGGEKAITDEKLTAYLTENMLIADIIDADFTELEEETINAKTEQLNGYLKDLNRGKITFKEAYNEFNSVEETEETESGETDLEDTSSPSDSLAKVIGKPDTDYAGNYSDYFEEILAMQTGEVRIIDKPDNAGKLLVVKKDITADKYYISTYEETIRHALGDEEFEKTVEEYENTLNFEEVASATKRFDVKKIYYPS